MRQWYITPVCQARVYGFFGAGASPNVGVVKHELHEATWAGKPGWLRHLILLMIGVISNDTLRIVTDIDMKIAVATEDNEPTSRISTQGARALFFLIFDADGGVERDTRKPLCRPSGTRGARCSQNAGQFSGDKSRRGPLWAQVQTGSAGKPY